MKYIKIYEDFENVMPETYTFLDALGNNLIKGQEYIYTGRIAQNKGMVVTDADDMENVRVILTRCSDDTCYFDVQDEKIKGRRISQVVLNLLDQEPEKTQEFISPV
jgi:hypothetical protein